MKKYVVFTAIVGGYDMVRQPIVVDDRFDYILFTDTDGGERQIGVWRVRRIDYHNEVQTKIARWVKTHPEVLLAEYEASLWLDANLQILSQELYDRVVDLYNQGVTISTVHNIFNPCVYYEMYNMVKLHLEKERVVLDWGRYLRKEGYPRMIGTAETSILYRQHSNHTIENVDKLWWRSIEHYSRRDQLSFCYSLWKNNIWFEFFLPIGETMRDTKMLGYQEVHADESKKWLKWGRWEAWIVRHAIRTGASVDDMVDLYYRIYAHQLPHVSAFIVGQFFRVKDMIWRAIKN